MRAALLVFLGSGIGGALRHFTNIAAARALGTGFPFGTFAVNVLGSLAMGLLAGWFALKAGAGWTQSARLFLMTGVLGGYTTFSAFSLDTLLLWERGQWSLAILYVAGSVLLSVSALAAGLAAMRALGS